MDNEQRSATTVIVQPERQQLGGDALRAEIDRLNSLLAAEEAREREAQLQAAPPRAIEEVTLLLFEGIVRKLGNPSDLDPLVRELNRAYGK